MSGYRNWILLTLVLAALPSLVHLPLWVTGVALIGGMLHYGGSWRKGWYGRGTVAALLLGMAAAIWFSFESWFSGDSVLSFFICVVFLKWAESRSRRDYLLLIFAAVILAAVGALYYENLFGLFHMFIVVFALAASLVAIHAADSGLNNMFLVRRSGRLFVLGLPLMLLLFLTFPRIPGPLWDIGLAFGFPVKAMMDRGPGEFGKLKTLQPGGIHRANQEKENVLVAEFQGTVPFKSRLYWRGPVFWEFDGENWHLPEDWDDRSQLLKRAIRSKAALDRELRYKSDPVRYTLRVMPSGGRWLYGLDVPAAPAPEAFISDEFQLLSIRKIADHEPKFPMLSYLEYGFGARLTEEQKKRGLSLPENKNPRLYALGRKLADRNRSSEEILFQALTLLAEGKYRYDPGHMIPPGDDMLDRFFFDEKRGGVEYLAGSFVMLMRAAGVPARLVSGFRGGTIIALTNFVIVKRSDAHAWVEIWQEGKGWRRVEPKDIILPPEEGKNGSQPDGAKAAAVELKTERGRPPEVKRQARKDKAPASSPGRGWKLPDWAGLLGNMQKWVIHYNSDRQTDILKGAGLEGNNWLDLLIGGAAGALSIFCFYLGVAWWRGRARLDRVSRAWKKFCLRMEKLGTRKMPQECPRDYLLRIGRERPELEAAADDIIRRYIDIRYGEQTSPEAARLFRRQVQRFTSMT
jgi:transglutaminase-like putative cysteine protease